MNSKELKEKVDLLVGKDHLEEALELLRKAGKDVTPLSNRLNRLKRKRDEGTHTDEYIDRKYNRLTIAILNKARGYPINFPSWVWIVIITPVLVAGVFAIPKILALIDKTDASSVEIQITGIIYDKENQPIEGVSVTIKEYPDISTNTNKEGLFLLPIKLDSTKSLKFEFSHNKFKANSELILIELKEDTFSIIEPIILEPIEEDDPPINNFIVDFKGEEWSSSYLVESLKAKGYQYTSSPNARFKIEITFPNHAIRQTSSGYQYNDALYPSILINGEKLEGHVFQLGTPPWPKAEEDELLQFLKGKLDEHFKNPNVFSKILEKL